MKSPFPGMDPFIEARGLWEDFHNHLIEAMFVALADTLSSRYLVRTGERGYIVMEQEEEEKKHPFIPDVAVTTPTTAANDAATAVAEPVADTNSISMLAYIEEEFRETFVEIREADTDKLVTCIEALSPSNKKRGSEGWELYQRKRQAILYGRTENLIEIDLLRGGSRMPMADRWPSSPYTLLVARRTRSPACTVWPAFSLSPLPPIPVPLLAPDADALLDLQPMIALNYKRARYSQSIDYRKPLSTLTAEEAAFLSQHLQTQP